MSAAIIPATRHRRPRSERKATASPKILVLGTNLEALLAAWVLRRNPKFSVRVLGARRPADALELPLAHRSALHTPALARFLRFLEVPYASFFPRDGILLKGSVELFPEVLSKLEPARAMEIYQRFTRKEVGFDLERSLPRAKRDRPRRLRWAPADLIESLMTGLDFVMDEVLEVRDGIVQAGYGMHRYDYLIITEPMIDLQPRLFFSSPSMRAVRRTLALVTAHHDRQFSRWDSVLTPFTPAQSVYRVSAYEHAYAVEMVGAFDRQRFLEELNFFFPTVFQVGVVRSDLWTVPVIEGSVIAPPGNVAMIGADAQCAPVTLDRVFDEAYRLLRLWGGRGYAR